MAHQPPASHDPHAVAPHHDHHHADHHDLTKDRAPAYTGLLASAVVLFALMLGMVKWTNGRFAGHSKAPGAAAEAHK